MANKKNTPPEPEVPTNDNIFQLKSVSFLKDIPVFLNYVNKIDTTNFELTIKSAPGANTCFLFIKDKKTQKVCMVPLTTVASMDLS